MKVFNIKQAHEELHKVCEKLKTYQQELDCSKRSHDSSILAHYVWKKHGVYIPLKEKRNKRYYLRGFYKIISLMCRKAYLHGFLHANRVNNPKEKSKWAS